MSERKDDLRKTGPAAVKPVAPTPSGPRTVYSATMGGAAAPTRLQPARVGEDSAVKPAPQRAAVTALKAARPASAKAKPAKAKAKSKAKAKGAGKAAPGLGAWGENVGGAALLDGYRSLTEAASDGWRAAAEAGERLMKNAEKVGKVMTAFADGELEAQAAAVRDLSGCRSFEALVAKQSGVAKAGLGRLAAHTEKMQRLSLDLARESLAPLEAQFDETTARIIRTLSA